MTQIKQIPNKHKCGRLMDMRITDYGDEKIPLGWMIYGICNKCDVVMMLAIFSQPEAPIPDVDFMLVDEIAKEGKKRRKSIL